MIEVDDSILKSFGCSPMAKEVPAPAKDFVAEPWMVDFVRKPHHQHEWDAFFAYCEAGPTKRRWIRIASFLASFFCLILPCPVKE